MTRPVGLGIAQGGVGALLLLALACTEEPKKLDARDTTRANAGPAVSAPGGAGRPDSVEAAGHARKSGSVGMMIRIEAEEDVTLIDPLGRVDSLAGDNAFAGIPGCKRFPGVGSLLVPPGEGQSVPTTMFELESVVPGEYLLRARAEADGLFFVQATLMIDGWAKCDESDSEPIRSGLVRKWAIGWHADPGADSCRVTIRRVADAGEVR